MDPIYHHLNRTPRVLSVQGYTDDNTIAGPTHDLHWVERVQYCYRCCRSAGFHIDSHECWQALSADTPAFGVQPVASRLDPHVRKERANFGTAREAILASFLPNRTLILIRSHLCVGLTNQEVVEILTGNNYAAISSLLAQECGCRCKTALVANDKLRGWSLRQLDQSGFGVHCVQGTATALGLLLLGRVQLAGEGLWKEVTHPTMLRQI